MSCFIEEMGIMVYVLIASFLFGALDEKLTAKEQHLLRAFVNSLYHLGRK